MESSVRPPVSSVRPPLVLRRQPGPPWTSHSYLSSFFSRAIQVDPLFVETKSMGLSPSMGRDVGITDFLMSTPGFPSTSLGSIMCCEMCDQAKAVLGSPGKFTH